MRSNPRKRRCQALYQPNAPLPTALAGTMAPKKAEPEPEPEPEAEEAGEVESGSGTFFFPDGSKYGAWASSPLPA